MVEVRSSRCGSSKKAAKFSVGGSPDYVESGDDIMPQRVS